MPTVLFDLSVPTAADAWSAIDDRVMGGVSRSRLRHDPAGHAVFEGEVSLEQNGGFASVRSSPRRSGPARRRGLPDRGARRPQAVQAQPAHRRRLRQPELPSPASRPRAHDWQVLRLPLSAFSATFRGRDVPGAPALDPARIRQVGLMIAARQAGPFALDIRRHQPGLSAGEAKGSRGAADAPARRRYSKPTLAKELTSAPATTR